MFCVCEKEKEGALKTESKVTLQKLIIMMRFSHGINQLYCYINCYDWLPIRVIMLISTNQNVTSSLQVQLSCFLKGYSTGVIEIAVI